MKERGFSLKGLEDIVDHLQSKREETELISVHGDIDPILDHFRKFVQTEIATILGVLESSPDIEVVMQTLSPKRDAAGVSIDFRTATGVLALKVEGEEILFKIFGSWNDAEIHPVHIVISTAGNINQTIAEWYYASEDLKPDASLNMVATSTRGVMVQKISAVVSQQLSQPINGVIITPSLPITDKEQEGVRRAKEWIKSQVPSQVFDLDKMVKEISLDPTIKTAVGQQIIDRGADWKSSYLDNFVEKQKVTDIFRGAEKREEEVVGSLMHTKRRKGKLTVDWLNRTLAGYTSSAEKEEELRQVRRAERATRSLLLKLGSPMHWHGNGDSMYTELDPVDFVDPGLEDPLKIKGNLIIWVEGQKISFPLVVTWSTSENRTLLAQVLSPIDNSLIVEYEYYNPARVVQSPKIDEEVVRAIYNAAKEMITQNCPNLSDPNTTIAPTAVGPDDLSTSPEI